MLPAPPIPGTVPPGACPKLFLIPVKTLCLQTKTLRLREIKQIA